MVESAKSCFEDVELDHLRALIRGTVEFHDWLERGSVDIAVAIQQGALLFEIVCGVSRGRAERQRGPFQ